MSFKILKTDAPAPEARQAILNRLVAYNDSKTGGNDYRPLTILITDGSGNVIGGLWGRTAYGWLFTVLYEEKAGLREHTALNRSCMLAEILRQR